MPRQQLTRNLFAPVVSAEQQHPSFAALASYPGSEPTRLMMSRVFGLMPSPDGNFVEQFQSTGFDARVFELYMFAYLESAGFAVSQPGSPDFIVTRGESSVARALVDDVRTLYDSHDEAFLKQLSTIQEIIASREAAETVDVGRAA